MCLHPQHRLKGRFYLLNAEIYSKFGFTIISSTLKEKNSHVCGGGVSRAAVSIGVQVVK